MSGVATLKLRGAKRHFDEMAVDIPHPSQSCSPSRLVMRPPPLKRGRCNGAPSVSNVKASPPRLPKPITTSAPSVATSPPPPEKLELEALAKHVPKRLKRVVDQLANGSVSLDDKLFSVVDLRHIVTSVVKDAEERLDVEFANVLHQKLAEQFRDFTTFNEDYVTRQLRGRDFAYLS